MFPRDSLGGWYSGKGHWADVPDAEWNNWKWQMRNRLSSIADFRKYMDLSKEEEDGLEYVKQGCGAMWDDKSPVKVFDTQEEAQKEADKWNTGQVVQYG